MKKKKKEKQSFLMEEPDNNYLNLILLRLLLEILISRDRQLLETLTMNNPKNKVCNASFYYLITSAE